MHGRAGLRSRWAAAGALLCAALACSREIPLRGEPACRALELAGGKRATGVVLIVGDSLRRDRLGSYGGSASTPAFDAFAQEHLLFERAYAQAPSTKASVATLFTSWYPSQHGVDHHPNRHQTSAYQRFPEPITPRDALAPELVTLAETLRAAGYRTAAFVTHPWLDRRFGFDQGFEHYDDSGARFGAPGKAASRAALDWLAQLAPDERFFVYLHVVDAHRPYGALEWSEVLERADELAGDTRPVTPRARHAIQENVRIVARRGPTPVKPTIALLELSYARGVENFDAALGVFLEGLRARPAWERSAVLVTADHGEPLFEHGYGEQGAGFYEYEVAVPLAARLPGVRPARARVDCAVGLIDVAPTLCRSLGVDCPEPLFGRPFVASSGEAGAARFTVVEGALGRPRSRALIGRRYKLVHEPDGAERPRTTELPYLLFDLERDPLEADDLLARSFVPWRIEDLERRMAEALDGAVPPAPPRWVGERLPDTIGPWPPDAARALSAPSSP